MMPTFSRPLSQRTRSGCALNRCLARSNIFRTVLARLLLWASSQTILLEKPSTQPWIQIPYLESIVRTSNTLFTLEG